MNNQQSQVSAQEIEQAYQNVKNGATVSQLLGIGQDKLESLYALAYSLYNHKNYADALKVFQALCTYATNDRRFWLGLGGCLDNLHQYREAASAFKMCFVVTGLKDPEPMYYMAQTCLKDNQKQAAIEVLEYIETMQPEGDERYLDFKDRSQALLTAIKEE